MVVLYVCVYAHIGASACVIVLYVCVYAHIGSSALAFVFMCMYGCHIGASVCTGCLLECRGQKIALVLFLRYQPPFPPLRWSPSLA